MTPDILIAVAVVVGIVRLFWVLARNDSGTNWLHDRHAEINAVLDRDLVELEYSACYDDAPCEVRWSLHRRGQTPTWCASRWVRHALEQYGEGRWTLQEALIYCQRHGYTPHVRPPFKRKEQS